MVMFYNIEKLNELEKAVSENLMKADGHTWKDAYRVHWRNYRSDMPICLNGNREYKKKLEDIQKGEK